MRRVGRSVPHSSRAIAAIVPAERVLFRKSARHAEETIASWTMSLIVHVVIVLMLSLKIPQAVEPGRPVIYTMLTQSPGLVLPEDDLDGLNVQIDRPPERENRLLVTPTIRTSPDRATEEMRDLSSPDPGEAQASRPGKVVEVRYPDVPANAVKSGSFTAWWIPEAQRYGEVVEPGQLPRARQDYQIRIRIEVPEGRTSLHVSDLSGEIVGTDGYRQLIPERAWAEIDGKLRLLRPADRLPVRNGYVEIVIKVGGAGKAGVRDLISIQSKLLDESQILTLEFQPASG